MFLSLFIMINAFISNLEFISLSLYTIYERRSDYMPKQVLVIGEKPSQIRTFSEILFSSVKTTKVGTRLYTRTGSWGGYLITFLPLIGHITNIDTGKGFGWNECSPIAIAENPKALIIKENYQYRKVIRSLAITSDELWLATDPDSEGDNIAYEAYIIAIRANKKLGANTKRVWNSSLTKKEVIRAFNQVQTWSIDQALAVQGRRVIDAWVGFAGTREVTGAARKVRRERGLVLSVGRVQLPTLKLIVDRDIERDAFNVQDKFNIIADLLDDSRKQILATVKHDSSPFLNKDEVNNILKKIANFTLGRITNFQKRQTNIPPLRPGLVNRPRLVRRMNEGLHLGQRLTLVAAPAGFGKTTVIREWISTLTGETASNNPEQRVDAAWLTLDKADEDPLFFADYLTAALQQADASLGQEIHPLLVSDDRSASREILTILINTLAGRAAPLVLVLDDYHHITDYDIHDEVAFLLENQPAGFHVVIGTREDPPLPLARLRARGQLTEIRERDLRFTTQEAAAFLNESMGLALPADAVSKLETQTEGWITGLQLAGLALRRESNTTGFVDAFSGDDRYIMDYLVSEVLQREPESVRRFLIRTAILDRLTAPLCDAVTGGADGQEMLEYLEQSNLFILPLDRRREWYRYHGLFAEMLRVAADHEDDAELHRRAAAWYQAAGMADQAAQHMRAYRGSAVDGTDRDASEQMLIEPLSERELEVLVLIAAGYSNAEIGQRLFIATGTVKRHINNIYGKLSVSSRTQAIARARQLGLIA